MNLIDKLREDQPAMSSAAFNLRLKAADAMQELVVALVRWQAAWDWADETVLVNASPAMLRIAEETDLILRRYGIAEAMSSVALKTHRLAAANGIGVVDLDASGRDTAQLTRTGMFAGTAKGPQ